ncbi:DUF4013 domain-containing protein [Natrialba swarupiae]|nr:DUF4013 domain-containing protein [Natrialba swarupiae]
MSGACSSSVPYSSSRARPRRLRRSRPRDDARGRGGSPAFDSWSELAATGVGAVAISLVYLLGPLVVGGPGVILGGVGYYGLQTVAPVLAGSEALVWGRASSSHSSREWCYSRVPP